MGKNRFMAVVLIIFLAIYSCSGDDNIIPLKIVGTWELSKYVDSKNDPVFPPMDGKPVQISFKRSGAYEGMAGNNEIRGLYRIEDNMFALTMSTTEISNTEWESMFKNAIEETRDENEYIIPFTLENGMLILQCNEEIEMYFVRI